MLFNVNIKTDRFWKRSPQYRKRIKFTGRLIYQQENVFSICIGYMVDYISPMSAA